MITQQEIYTYYQHKATLKEKEDKLSFVKAKLSDMENSLIARLKTGEEVEPGQRNAKVQENTRRTVPWKDIVTTLKGQAYVMNLIQKAEPKVTVRLDIYG